MGKNKEPKYVLLVKGVGEIPVRNRKHAESQIAHWQSVGKEGQDFLVFTPGGARVPLVLDAFGHYVLTSPIGEESPVDKDMLDEHQKNIFTIPLERIPGAPSVDQLVGIALADAAAGEPAKVQLLSAEEVVAASREADLQEEIVEPKQAKKAKRKKFAELKQKALEARDEDEEPTVTIPRHKLADLYLDRDNWKNLAAQRENSSVEVDEKVAAEVLKAQREWQQQHDLSMINFGLIPVGVLAEAMRSWEQLDDMNDNSIKIILSFRLAPEDFRPTDSPAALAISSIGKAWEKTRPVDAAPPGNGVF